MSTPYHCSVSVRYLQILFYFICFLLWTEWISAGVVRACLFDPSSRKLLLMSPGVDAWASEFLRAWIIT